ncbi:MAG: 4-hydroxythreonine-4-phosphate dehydrogenase PdxA, partial [Sphaerochaetaceae bacterium]
MNDKPVLGILTGDGAGVGPEIIAKLAVGKFFEQYCKPIVIGDVRILERAFSVIGSSVPMQVISDVEEADWDEGLPVLDQKDQDPAIVKFGTLTVEAGKANLNALKLGVELFQEKKIDGFCFAPFHKAGLKKAGSKVESEH